MTQATAEESRFAADYQFAATHALVLKTEPARIQDRSRMEQRLNERCAEDPTLRQELLTHPRAIYAIAAEESFGIHRSLFFVQIRRVEILVEDQSTLGVVLPACHLGCVAPRLLPVDRPSPATCHICKPGKQSCAQNTEQLSISAANREGVRNWIQTRAGQDEPFLEQLVASPDSILAQVKQELEVPENHPLNQIRGIETFVETAETIGFVLDFQSAQTTHQ